MLRRWSVAIASGILILASLGCSRSEAAGASRESPYDPKAFLASATMACNADLELAGLALHHSHRADTKEVATLVQNQQASLRAAILTLAGSKGVTPTSAQESKRIALRDNLAILVGEAFDQGYALGMVQDLNGLIKLYEAASRGSDPDVARFASSALPSLQQQQRAASDLLNRLGGSPFGYPP